MQKKVNEIEIQILKTYHYITTLWMFVMFVYVNIISRLSLYLFQKIYRRRLSLLKHNTHVNIYFYGTGLHLRADIFYLLFIRCYREKLVSSSKYQRHSLGTCMIKIKLLVGYNKISQTFRFWSGSQALTEKP